MLEDRTSDALADGLVQMQGGILGGTDTYDFNLSLCLPHLADKPLAVRPHPSDQQDSLQLLHSVQTGPHQAVTLDQFVLWHNLR